MRSLSRHITMFATASAATKPPWMAAHFQGLWLCWKTVSACTAPNAPCCTTTKPMASR